MRGYFTTLLVLGTLSLGGWAADIQKGAAMRVKPDFVWFQDKPRLSHWQKLKKNHSPELESYQKKVLSARNAWQFTSQQPVKILSYDAATNQVKVEMEMPGRLQGSRWWLDASALME
jgi:hypothetical protein